MQLGRDRATAGACLLEVGRPPGSGWPVPIRKSEQAEETLPEVTEVLDESDILASLNNPGGRGEIYGYAAAGKQAQSSKPPPPKKSSSEFTATTHPEAHSSRQPSTSLDKELPGHLGSPSENPNEGSNTPDTSRPSPSRAVKPSMIQVLRVS